MPFSLPFQFSRGFLFLIYGAKRVFVVTPLLYQNNILVNLNWSHFIWSSHTVCLKLKQMNRDSENKIPETKNVLYICFIDWIVWQWKPLNLITLRLRENDNIRQMITKSAHIQIKSALQMVTWIFVNLRQIDPINRMKTISLVTLRSLHCISIRQKF